MTGVNTGVSGNPLLKKEQVGCTDAVVGVVESVEDCVEVGKRKKLLVNIGAEVVTIVSSWTVNVGNIVAVATVGSFCGDVEVLAATVAGVETNGRLLDPATLGWAGGSSSSAAILPRRCEVGDSAPEEKPKLSKEELAESMKHLFVATKKPKKKSKEEKAAEKAAKKAAREAKKEAEMAQRREGSEEEVELVKASKAQLKKCKSEAAKKRKAGEVECLTDDELEAAGFMAQ